MAGDKQPSLMTPYGVCSFPNLAKPRQQNTKDKSSNKKPRYSTIIAFTPKLMKREGAKEMLKAMMQSALACLEAKFPGKAKAMVENGKLNWPFRSMDDEDPDDTPHNFPAGTIWIQPATTGKPGIVDRYADASGDPVEIEDDEIEELVYAGCLIRATVRAYYYDTDGNKGVSFSLNNVQKVGEGDRLDGRKKATKEFDAVEDADDVDLEPRKKSAAKKRPRDEEDEDEPAPKRRRPARDEEEEDEPAPKRRRAARDDDEEEEEPAPKRRARKDPIGSAADDEDDEETTVPRSRKRARDEEDEEDEAPVRRKTAKRGRTLDDTL